MMERLAAALATAVILLPASAFAQVSIGLLPIKLTGELSESSSDQFETTLASKLQRPTIAVTSSTEVATASGRDVAALTDCVRGECLENLTKQANLHGVIRTELGGALNMYNFELEILSPTGQSIAAVDGACDLCSREELLESLGTHAERLAGELPLTGAVRLTLSPPDATVTVDGEPTESRELELPPGQHSINVSADSYSAEERSINVTLGDETALTISLEESSEDGNGGNGRPETRRLDALGIAGIVLTVSGGLAVAAGIGVTAIDGNCAGGRTDASGQCELIYSSIAPGAATLATGSAALITGVVLLVVSRLRRRRAAQVESLRLGRLIAGPLFHGAMTRP